MKFYRAISAALIAGILLGTAAAQKPARRKVRVTETTDSVSPQVAQAEDALRANDLAKAETLLQTAATATPNDYHVWYDLGFVYRATKRPELAAEAYGKSAALKPDLFETQFESGMALGAISHMDEAATALRAATKLKPVHEKNAGPYDAWLALGRVLKEKHPGDSAEAFQQAAMLRPEEIQPIFESGEAYAAAGKSAEAIAAFERVLELRPSNAGAMDKLIKVLVQSGQLEEAESRLREHLMAEPNDGEANLRLGRLILTGKKPEEAAFYLEAALKAFPERTELMMELATSYRAAKRWSDLSALLGKVMQSDSKSADIAVSYGDSLMHELKYGDAQAAFLQAIKLDPKSAEAFAGFAFASNGNKQYPVVLQALDARAKLAPENPSTLFLRAVAYDNLHMQKEAVEAYHRFLSSAPAGPLTDQRWQAEQRLKALEGDARPKKKN